MWRRPLLAVGVALMVLGVVLLLPRVQHDAGSVSAAPAETPSAAWPDTPSPTPTTSLATAVSSPSAAATTATVTRLSIASIGLDHAIAGAGLSRRGTIDPEPGTIMWFDGLGRVQPGATGTAVIAGHVSNAGKRDVFADLGDVVVGDTVDVVLSDGTTVPNVVTRASAIDKQLVTTDQSVWGANATGSRLALITCDDAQGFRADRHRVANLVIIAERR